MCSATNSFLIPRGSARGSSFSQFPTYKGLPSSTRQNLPVASTISENVLCLPLYPDLQLENISNIVELISKK